MTWLITIVAATICSYFLGFVVRRMLLRWNIVDKPNARSNHTEVTVRGGGIGILLAWAGCVAASGWFLQAMVWLAAVALLAVVSFVDDWRPLPAAIRFGCHATAAAVMIAVLFLPMAQVDWPLRLAVLGLAWFWVVGYTNAFNFMDGINGLAATQAVVTGIGMAVVVGVQSGRWDSLPALFSLAIAGAALGFLSHNFPKARMFMGDVGSASIGFILATLVLWLARDIGWEVLPVLVMLHANFIMDTAITLVRRMIRGETWYQAHREHFYQRLVRSGKSHAFVTLWEIALQAVALGILLLSLSCALVIRWCLVASVAVLWGAFFVWIEISFRRISGKQA